MHQPSASADSAISAPPHSTVETQLRGNWLLLARIGWITLTVTIIVLNLLALQETYTSLLTKQVAQNLHKSGLSPTVYATIWTVESGVYALVYVAMGLLLFLRRSSERMALFCALMLVTFGGAAGGGFLYDITSGFIPSILANNAVLRIVVLFLVVVGQVSFLTFFYLFPSGQFVLRWTRWCALLGTAFWLATFFLPALSSSPAGVLILVFVITAVIAQIYRYRHVSTSRERQQTKWVVFGFVLAILSFVAIELIALLLPPAILKSPVGSLAGNSIINLAFLLIPIFIAIAILRSRLWDIDRIINKALVYGSLTVLLAAVYVGLIIGLESLAGVISGQNTQPVVIVISTLVIAALFQPLRRRLQHVIDRRFYRKKYDAEKTLAAFSATLRNEVNLEQLRAQLEAVVQETMQPRFVSLWVRPLERHVGEQLRHLEPHRQVPNGPSGE